jgi:DNA-binding response OmpR family regulator
MKKRILVVDDDDDLRRLIRIICEREGYEMIEAANGEQAMARALDSGPELILLDMMMPDHNGLDVCRWLKANDHTQDIPVIMVSAYATPKTRREGLQAGAVEFISKPFSPFRLIERMRVTITPESNAF